MRESNLLSASLPSSLNFRRSVPTWEKRVLTSVARRAPPRVGRSSSEDRSDPSSWSEAGRERGVSRSSSLAVSASEAFAAEQTIISLVAALETERSIGC